MNTNLTPNTPDTAHGHNGSAPCSAGYNGLATPGSCDSPSLLRRLAAQLRAPKQSARGEAWEHDPIARPRDKHDNPQQREIVFLSPAPGDDKRVADTPKATLIELVAAHDPMRAVWLHDFYDHSVLPALKRYQDTVRDAWEKVAHHNAEAERQNAALEARRAELEGERDARTSADLEAILALDAPLAEAHRAAAEKTARSGGAYDPHNPAPEAVLRHARRSLEDIAGEHGIPWTPGDKARRLSKEFLWALTAGTGAIIGISLAIFGHFLEPDTMARQLPVFAGAIGVGFIVAAGGGWAVKHSWRAASERYYLARYHGYGLFYWLPSAVIGFLVTVAVIGMDAAIEYGGLLKAARLEQATDAGAQALPVVLAYLVGVVITFGYVLTYAREGSLDGRYHPCLNRIVALQEADFSARDEQLRSQPEAQDALAAIAVVREVQRARNDLEARVASTAAPFEAEIARLEGLKVQPQRELTLDVRRSIQDAHDDWVGAHAEWARLATAIIEAHEPRPAAASKRPPRNGPSAPKKGFLNWVRGLFGRRNPRNTLEGRLSS